MNKTDKRYCTQFFVKYVSLSIYDVYLKKRYTIDQEDIIFVKKYGYAFIGNPDKPDGISMDHGYFFMHDDLFDRIISTNHNDSISLKIIPRYLYFPSINDISNDPSTNLMKKS